MDEESDDVTASGDPTHTTHTTRTSVQSKFSWIRTWVLLVLAAAAVLTYQFLFDVTKPSPIWGLGPAQLATVGAYSVLTAVGIATLLLPSAKLGDWISFKQDWPAELGTKAWTTFLYGLGFVALLENMLYSVIEVGLKTENSFLFKISYALLGCIAGLYLTRITSALSARGVRRCTLVTLGLALIATGVVVNEIATRPSSPEARQVASLRPYNVVILSSDGVDARNMSLYGYERETTPFLDSKQSEFQVFENAFTNNGNTTGSITSLLTGMSPLTTGVVYPPDILDARDARRTVPGLLKELGYFRSNWAVPHYADGRSQNMVGAFDVDNGYRVDHSPIAQLPVGTGPQRWFLVDALEGLGRLVEDVVGYRELDNPFSEVAAAAGDRTGLGDARRLAAITTEIRDNARFFINAHFMVTHGPIFAITKPRFSMGQTQDEAWMPDFYDDSIRQFDKYVATVYDALRRAGKLDRTILVITSDHGQQWDARERVPLMIRYPSGAPSGAVRTNVQRLDVAPTILDVLGVETPDWMEGLSLRDPGTLESDRQILAANVAGSLQVHQQGFRVRDAGLVLTAVRCSHYVRVSPDGTTEKGRVAGSTSTCSQRPTIPADVATHVEAMR